MAQNRRRQQRSAGSAEEVPKFSRPVSSDEDEEPNRSVSPRRSVVNPYRSKGIKTDPSKMTMGTPEWYVEVLITHVREATKAQHDEWQARIKYNTYGKGYPQDPYANERLYNKVVERIQYLDAQIELDKTTIISEMKSGEHVNKTLELD